MLLQRAISATRCLSVLTAKRWMSDMPQKAIASHAPNTMERYFLVWTGKYKSLQDVPNMVNKEVMERCRNKMRIRIANIMTVFTILGACYAIYSGKQAAKRGETVSKQNIDWHKEYNAKYANKEGNE